MSLITPDFGLLVWMTIIFAIVFFVLAKFGFPIITGMVDKRSERINGSIAKAKEAEEQLATMSEQTRKLIEEARAQQASILKEASEARDSLVASAREQAREEAQKVMDAARKEIDAEREAALCDIRRQVADLSMEVAEKIMRKDLQDQDAQLELIEKMVEEAQRSHLIN